MIEQLRSQRGKMVIKYIIIGITISMVFGSILSPIISWWTGEGTQKKQQPIITINDHEIYPPMVEQRAISYHQQIEAARQQLGEQADMLLRMIGYDKPPQELALNAVINEVVLQSAAQQAGLTHMSSGLLQEKVKDRDFAIEYLDPIIDAGMYNNMGGFQEAALQRKLARIGMTYDDFMKQVENALQRKLYMDIVGASVYMPDHEARSHFLQNQTQRTFGYIPFDLTTYVDNLRAEGVDRETLRQFFEEANDTNKRYWKREQRAGTYWTFTPDTYGLSISEEKVNTYYQNNKTSYIQEPAQVEIYHIFLETTHETRQSVREKAQAIAQELQNNPDNFASKAREVSDANDASEGGYIGFVKRRDPSYNDKMLKAAFALENDQDVSDPIEVENGFEIVGRNSRRSATYKPLEEVADEIRSVLRKQQFTNRFKTDARQARRQGTIEEFIEQRNGTQHNIAPISQDQAQKQYETVLFTQINNVGKYTVYLDEKTNTGYIVKLTEIQPPYLPELDEQINQVREDYYQSEAHKRMKGDIEEAYTMISDNNASLEDVAQKLQKSVTNVTISGEQDDTWSQLEKQGLPTQRMQRMIHEGYAIESTQADHGYIVMLTSMQPLDEELYIDQKPTIRQNIQQTFENQHIQAFIASLHKNAKIDYNRDDKQRMNQ